jgi:predicted nucleic acid-binding Zn ribbon protein
MTDKPIKKCPACHKNTAQRLIGAGMGIIFKGSGFYETDYKRAPVLNEKKDNNSTKSEHKPQAGRSEAAKKSEKSEKNTAQSKPQSSGKEQ